SKPPQHDNTSTLHSLYHGHGSQLLQDLEAKFGSLKKKETGEESSPSSNDVAASRFSDAVSSSSMISPTGLGSDCRPTTPTPSSSGLRLPKTGTKSSKRTCAICLTTMKTGQGHAIFTAECSHSFHFHCITSNVKHGNQVCPVCRAKWKEIPFQSPASDLSRDHQPEVSKKSASVEDSCDNNSIGMIEVKTFPEVPAVQRSASHDNFNVLIHLKAPLTSGRHNSSRNQTLLPVFQNSRVPVDLVTVLDVSGSMAARRLFPLRRMTETGRQQALQAVNSLVSNGGTNIAEALRKGTKVLVDRKWKNPVCSIILLSDGQDTYTVTSPGGVHPRTDYQLLLPVSIRRNNGAGLQIPVHAFGFGADHDAASMHSISEISGGTFSFIEAEGVIQDAFAQCIGGLLSVVVQELLVRIECVHPSLQLGSIKAGSYRTSMMADARMGSISVGDLYAEEERDFLVTINIPVVASSYEMSLVKVRCVYRDPITKEMVNVEEASEVMIQRPEVVGELIVSMEVDRQRNRLHAAEAMSEARVAAENGDLVGAVSVLESCRRALSESASARAGDRLCASLSAELKEMQERMGNRRAYEESGRAYVLSGLSSHSWQRATARGDSTDSTSLVQSYQTPSMIDMVTRSQTMLLGNPSPRRTLSTTQSFPAKSQ
ncbi:Zinc finger C3HC4-type RING finger family protein, partial [Prunus dulcis]